MRPPGSTSAALRKVLSLSERHSDCKTNPGSRATASILPPSLGGGASSLGSWGNARAITLQTTYRLRQAPAGGAGGCRWTNSKAPAQRRGTAGNHKMVVAVAIAFSCLFSLLDKFYSILIYLPTTIKYHHNLVMHSCWHLLWDNEFYIPAEETANKTDQVLSRNKAEKCGQKGGPLIKPDKLRVACVVALQTQRPQVTTEDDLKWKLPN